MFCKPLKHLEPIITRPLREAFFEELCDILDVKINNLAATHRWKAE